MMKIDINLKASLLVTLSISLIAIGLLTGGYLSVRKLRFETIGLRQKQDSEIFSNIIARQIENQISEIKSYLGSPWWQEAVATVNQRYVNLKPKAIGESMARMDEQWIIAAADSPLVQEALSSRMGYRLKLLAEDNPVIAEIFLTDKYGGLVASSNKTSDYYQADEPWWQKAYNSGKGSIFVGQPDIDESSGKISIAIAVPMKDQTGQVIGVSKVALDILEFFESMKSYTFGQTGHVALFEAQGKVIYSPGAKAMSKSEVSVLDLDRILNSKKGYALIPVRSKEMGIVAVAKIKSPVLEENEIRWLVVVSEAEKEVFAPLYKIFSMGILLVLIIAVSIMLTMRYIMQAMFIYPLEKIRSGANLFADGKLNYHIAVNTGDEFEQLAGALNEMALNLKRTMVSRDKLAAEIAHRKGAELQLDASERRFVALYESSADAIMTMEPPSWKYTSGNRSTVEMFKVHDEKHFISLGPCDLSPEFQPDGKRSSEKVKMMIEQTVRDGVSFFKWTHRRFNGEDFPTIISLTSVVMQGSIVIQAMVRDISKETAYEQQLMEDRNMLALKSQELDAALKEALKSREILSSMLKDNNEIRDKLEQSISEVQKNHQMVLQSEKLASIGQLAAGIAHEINNPTGFIGSNISTMDKYMADITRLFRVMETLKVAVREGNLGKAQKVEKDIVSLEKEMDIAYILSDADNLLRETQEGVERIGNIVRDLKTFSHSGDVARTTSSLCKIIDSVLNIVWNEIKYKAELKKDYVEDLMISCNPQQLGQVFINILVNAAQAIKDKGVITIRTYAKDGKAHVDISDTGCGISEPDLTRIFDPFFTTKAPGKGTGLGLGISAEIVKKHGGSIAVDSVVGQGTTFKITLPFNSPEE